VVVDRYLHVAELLVPLKLVRHVRRHVQYVTYSIFCEPLEVFRVFCVSEIQVRQDLDGEPRRVVRRRIRGPFVAGPAPSLRGGGGEAQVAEAEDGRLGVVVVVAAVYTQVSELDTEGCEPT